MSRSHRRAAAPGSLLVTTIATFFGTGLSPVWPGTMGTLASVPLAYLLSFGGRGWLIATTLGLLALGTWAAERYCQASGTHDNQNIVIDETVGYLLTLWLVALTPLNLALGFGLFRLFDIWKPWPIRLIDRKVKGGFGVMADDLCAGAIAALILWLMQPLPPLLFARLGLFR